MSDQPGTDAPEPDAPEAKPATTGSEAPEWLSPITDRMNELGESTGLMAEQLAALYQSQQQEEPAEELDEADLYGDDGELTPEGAQSLIDSRVGEVLQQELSKRDAARMVDEREDAFEALREEIPALQDDKLAARLVRDAAAYLESNGQQALIDTPMFVDLIEDRYKRELYEARVSEERDGESGREVVLESASGASQPTGKKEQDWGDRIVKAAQSLRPQI